MDRDEIIATLRRLGMEPRHLDAIDDTAAAPFDILTAADHGGHAFAHVVGYDAEMIEAERDYPEWVRQWAAATDKENVLSDVAAHVDFRGGPSWLTYVLDGMATRLEFVQEADRITPDVAETIVGDFGDVPGRTRVHQSWGGSGAYAWVPDDSVDAFLDFVPEFSRD